MTVMTTQLKHAPRIPVLRLSWAAHVLVFKNLLNLLRVSWLWLLIQALLVATLHWYLWPAAYNAWEAPNPASDLLYVITIIISLLAGSSIAVAWHRYILEGDPLDAIAYLRLDGVVQTYFALAVCFALSAILPIIVLSHAATMDPAPSFFDVAMTFFALLLAIWTLTRLCLLLPSIAVDRTDTSIWTMWERTDGLFWRLFTGAVLTSILPLSIGIGAIMLIDPGSLVGPPLDRFRYVVSVCVFEACLLVFSMIGTAFFALSFQALEATEAQGSQVGS